jgi:trehalose-6-phosphate synthase
MTISQLKDIITRELNQDLRSKKTRKADLIQMIQEHAAQDIQNDFGKSMKCIIVIIW